MSRESVSPVLIAGVIVVVLGLSLSVYMMFFKNGPEPEEPHLPTVSPPPKDAEQETSGPAPRLELPPLDESDDVVRSLVAELSAHPRLVEWLATDGLVRRFVAAVSNVARGESPRTHLAFLDPGSGFVVEEEGDRTVVSPRSYERYDLLTRVVSSLDNEGMARLYNDLLPLFEEAYAELGHSDTFAEAFDRAVERLRSVPVPEGEVEVKQMVRAYRFTDPELESLSAAEKQLLRLGPANAREIQSKLTQIKVALAVTRAEDGD